MGYYSSVALTIHKNDYLRMIAESKTYGESAFVFITKGADIYGDESGNGKSPVALYWSYVKWSNLYDEVGFVMDFIKSVPYSFKRVGESCDDIESECNFDDDDDMALDDVAQIQSDIYIDSFPAISDWRELFGDSQTNEQL